MIGAISEGGDRPRVFLHGTHIETRWIADHHVVWQPGQRNRPAEGDPAHHTHCSAYVPAAALYLDIYILRPPQSFPSREGPQVVTAGVRNFKSAAMQFAFGDHPLGWPNQIQLFVHNTALE